jgi:8-oxo-dGTP diphosphatase
MAGTDHVIEVAAAIITEAGRILIVQRPDGAAMGGLREFPGGKIEPGETPEVALMRELAEELGIAVSVGPLYHVTGHRYPGGPHVRLFFYHCGIVTGRPQLLWGQAFRWIAPAALPTFPTPAADQAVVARLSGEQRAASSEG